MNITDNLEAALSNCDKEQLNLYLNDEESLESLVKSMDQYQELVSAKERLQQSNRILAQANLNKEGEINSVKAKLEEAIKEFEEAKSNYMEVKDTFDAQQAVNGDMSLDSVFSRLQSSASKAEETSDMQADDFFTKFNSFYNDDELNAFQRQFLDERTKAHILKIKAEKMKELLPSSH